MKLIFSSVAALVALAVIPLPVLAQAALPEQATLAELRELRQWAVNQAELPEELRTQLIELHDAAIAALETADDNRSATIEFERDRLGIDEMVADLKKELDRPTSAPQPSAPDDATVGQAEDLLTRARSLLAANVAALREQQRLTDDRNAVRVGISQRLGALDLERELINRDLRAQIVSSVRLELKTAVRLNLLAKLERADSEIEMLRAQLALLADRSSLVPLMTDLAQRRVAKSEELVQLLTDKTYQLRLEKARMLLTRARDLSRQTAERLPQLAPTAIETEAMAETLWGEDGIVIASQKTVKDLAEMRNHQTQLHRIGELTQRKFEAYGHRGSIQRWWPDVPDDFPETATITNTLRFLDAEIPEVEHRLIIYEQQRARAYELRRETVRGLRDELGDGWTSELERQVQGLFSARQDILDRLIQHGGRYSNQLVEYRAVSGNFLNQVEGVERFLYSQILWSRSVPRPLIPRIRDIAAAFRWAMPSKHLDEISWNRAVPRGNLLLTLLVLMLVLALRRVLISQRQNLAVRVSDPVNDNLFLTVRATIASLLLAAPLPLALYFTGLLIGRAGHSPYWSASSTAFIELAIVAALFEAIRQIFAPRGLAENHFGWPTSATRPLFRGLLVTEAVGLPLLYVAIQLAFVGGRLNSPAELQLYNNSLGRLAFIAGSLVFGIAILSMLRPEKKSEPLITDMRVPWPSRFSGYAFPTAFLGAYPIVIFATIVPVMLAAFGYYITGLLLSHQMLRTLVLATIAMVGGGLIHRSQTIRRNRMLLDAENNDTPETQLREVETAEKQTRQLFRFSMMAVLVFGLFAIWSDALPLLQALKRVQLLPRVELLEPADDRAASLGAVEKPVKTASPQQIEEGNADTEPSTTPGIPGMPPSTTADTAADSSHPLTLWLLLEAMIALIITIILARNLPGVIEITLKRRTTLDAGARFAFSTLVKYTTTIVGSVVVFSLLGIGWGKVQWLAAALTFGLGFGLQEIVANFVSGLILLIERPVRVGDVVTIGNLMGKVSRIQIRATTITLWDRSEMIVPNKEFITTKLVNWTLSDSKRRIEIPLRVGYGADLEKVKSLLISAAEAHPLVLDDPAPQALLLTFGDDAINFELRFVVDFGNGIKAKDDVQMAIDQAFRENGVDFALPQLRLGLPDTDSTASATAHHEQRDKEDLG